MELIGDAGPFSGEFRFAVVSETLVVECEAMFSTVRPAQCGADQYGQCQHEPQRGQCSVCEDLRGRRGQHRQTTGDADVDEDEPHRRGVDHETGGDGEVEELRALIADRRLDQGDQEQADRRSGRPPREQAGGDQHGQGHESSTPGSVSITEAQRGIREDDERHRDEQRPPPVPWQPLEASSIRRL